MTADRETTRIVRSWLRADEHESADQLLETVLARLGTTPQRRPWWPARRFTPMNRLVLAASAAAAVLVVAILGYTLLPGITGVGGRSTPVPTVTPTPLAVPPSGLVGPGTYRVTDFTNAPVDITIPAGWQSVDGWVTKGDWLNADGVAFTPYLVTHVYMDSCHPTGTLRAVASKDALVAALGEQAGHATVGPTQVTLGGLSATKMVLSVARSAGTTGCNDPLRIWPDPGPDESGGLPLRPGHTVTVYVVERGGQMTAIVAESSDRSASTDTAQLQAMVASIAFLP